ncbi:MAG: hypothetical protein MSC53_06860 [Arcanobacterium sp.]|nr:hypothetical protein [Arcanobacterium sp.]
MEYIELTAKPNTQGAPNGSALEPEFAQPSELGRQLSNSGETSDAPPGWWKWLRSHPKVWLFIAIPIGVWIIMVLLALLVVDDFPQDDDFNWWIHNIVLFALLVIPLLGLLGIMVISFHLTSRVRNKWLKALFASSGVAVLLFTALAAFFAFLVFIFTARSPGELVESCPPNRYCEYTSPFDLNDGYVNVYREGLVFRYFEQTLDPFGHNSPKSESTSEPESSRDANAQDLAPLSSSTAPEMVAQPESSSSAGTARTPSGVSGIPELISDKSHYPPSCEVNDANKADYAVIIFDKAGPANHNLFVRAEDTKWILLADLEDTGACMQATRNPTTNMLTLTFQDANGNQTIWESHDDGKTWAQLA